MYLSQTDTQQFPSALRALIEAELEDREKISWVGKPVPRKFARRSIPIFWLLYHGTHSFYFGSRVVLALKYLILKKGLICLLFLVCHSC